MIEGVSRMMRRLPPVRGRVNAAWWLGRHVPDRRKHPSGRWRMTMAEGAVLELPQNSSMTWEVAFSGQYDAPYLELARRYITPGSLVLDVGASLGLWTVQLARTARSVGAEIWAVEPAPANVRWLERNVTLNSLNQLVQIYPIALGSAPGSLKIKLNDPDGGNAEVAFEEEPGASVVQVRRMDDLPRARSVSFIKLDVEGFELEILRGARQLLEKDHPVVFGEFSRSCLEERGEDLGAFLRELDQLGYQSHKVALSRSRPWRAVDRAQPVPIDISGEVLAQDLLLVPRK